MTLGRIFALVALLLAAVPAQAGIVARFAQPDQPPFTVEVGESGESRMTVAEAVYVTAGGVTYMILTDAAGRYVARQADFLSLLDELNRAAGPSQPLPGDGRPVLSETGAETVAGRSGRVFRLSHPTNPSDNMDFVVSADPDLAPLGQALAANLRPVFAVVGQSFPGFAEAIGDVLGRGTLLRFGPLWTLESLESAPIPPEAFTLPSAPLDRAALAARLGIGAPR